MFEIIIVIGFIVYGTYIVLTHRYAEKIKDPLYRFLFEMAVAMLPLVFLVIVTQLFWEKEKFWFLPFF
jgi:hypothetical protein